MKAIRSALKKGRKTEILIISLISDIVFFSSIAPRMEESGSFCYFL